MVGLPNGHDSRGMKGGFATCLLSSDIAREREGKIGKRRPTNRQFGNAQLILMQSGELWEWKLMIANVPE